MRHLAFGIALATLPVLSIAAEPARVVVIAAEKASGFASLDECNRSLGPTSPAAEPERSELRGSLFNRLQGNRSECRMVGGEPLVVVYPRGE